jgi:hypothetical protein
MYKDYRTAVEDAAAAWFRRRGCPVEAQRPYVLASHDTWLDNIIIPEVRSIVESVRPRHTMVHHGLSSQALAFNLFGPLMLRQDLAAAKPAFEAAGIQWPSPQCIGQFEFDDPNVFAEIGRDQPTSWDIAMGSSGGEPSLLVEVKFVEHDLGSCSVFTRGDCDGANPARNFDICYLHSHKKRRYLVVAEELGLLETAAFAGAICPFTIYYQFFREVAFAAVKRASMIYVLDDRNPALFSRGPKGHGGRIPFLMALLPSSLSSLVSVVTIPTILSALEASNRHDNWLGEFRTKYGFNDRISL